MNILEYLYVRIIISIYNLNSKNYSDNYNKYI